MLAGGQETACFSPWHILHFTLVLPCAFTLAYPYATTFVYRCAYSLAYSYATTLVHPCALSFVCQCAGYYGNSQSQTFNESSTSGRDYLAEVCRDWENAAQQAKTKRVVIVRTGIVLAKEGGAMAKMLPIFNIFAGGPLGNGQQWCSWIHRFVAAFISFCFSLISFQFPVASQSLRGVVPGVAHQTSWLENTNEYDVGQSQIV